MADAAVVPPTPSTPSAPVPADTLNWGNLERLVLLHAITKYGESNWTQITEALKNFFSQDENATRLYSVNFTPQSCQAVYQELLDYETKKLKRSAETALASLTERFRQERIKELKKGTKDKEIFIKQLHRDITSIKTGKMDSELTAILRLPDKIDLSLFSASATPLASPIMSSPTSAERDSKRKRKLEISFAENTESISSPLPPPLPLESPEERLEKFRSIWETIYSHKLAVVFREPVPLAAAPDYDSVIKHRMDLGTLRTMMEAGDVTTTADFNKHMLQIFINAMT